jgi:hypothetical protein
MSVPSSSCSLGKRMPNSIIIASERSIAIVPAPSRFASLLHHRVLRSNCYFSMHIINFLSNLQSAPYRLRLWLRKKKIVLNFVAFVFPHRRESGLLTVIYSQVKCLIWNCTMDIVQKVYIWEFLDSFEKVPAFVFILLQRASDLLNNHIPCINIITLLSFIVCIYMQRSNKG